MNTLHKIKIQKLQLKYPVKMIVEKQMECKLAGETEVLGDNLPQRHFCSSQYPT
jgi:hypothetical protein